MTDIVDRLRKWSVFGYGVEASADMKEAADEITKLRAEVAEQVQWVKDLADRLIAEEAKTTTLRAEVARLRAALVKIDLLNTPLHGWSMSDLIDQEIVASGIRAVLAEENKE